MGCCLSRTKDEKFKNYNSETSQLTKITKINEKAEKIDIGNIEDILKSQDRYNSEKSIVDISNLESHYNLPSFNYGAVLNSQNNNSFIRNDSSFTRNDMSFDLDILEDPLVNTSALENSFMGMNCMNRNLNYSLDSGNDETSKGSKKVTENMINFNSIKHASYFSINSNILVGDGESYNSLDTLPPHKNVFSKKNFVFFYFEIYQFIFWAREYVISLYPEINLIMIIEINDSKLTQEKIVFTKTNEDFNKYFPMKKKNDMRENSYRILQAFEVGEKEKDFPFKFNISFYTYTNHKMLAVCSEEIFVKINKDGEMQKYKLYRNVYMKHYNKKVGNLMLNFAYKSSEIYPMDIDIEKRKILKCFSDLNTFSKFDEENELNFVYYGVDNFLIKENGNPDNKNQNYFSIRDIDEVEIGMEIRSVIKLDRLLELLNIVKKKFEFYQILKKLYFISTREFKEEKLINFKEILLKRLEEFSEKKELSDKIIIPFIFTALKKSFFKIKNPNSSNKTNQKNLTKRSSSNVSMNTSIDKSEKIQDRNNELLIQFFTVSLSFLRVDIQEDISLSALNFIYKYFEECLPINIDTNGCISMDEYFLDYIIINKSYLKFCDMLMKFFEYQACVQPIFGILARLVRNKKTQCQELVDFFNSVKFGEVLKRIIRIHDCNSVIITNIFSTIYNLLDNIEVSTLSNIISFQRLKEVFNIFKMNGFDMIHETSIHLVKGILLKKTEKSSKKSTPNDSNKSEITTNTTKITDEEHIDVITIFSNALLFLRNKIIILDFFKLTRWVYNVMTHLYTIAHIINNTNVNNLPKIIKFIAEKKITEYIVDCLFVVAEKKIFEGIDNAYDILDLNLINLKIMIFRAVFHCLALIKTLKDILPATLPRNSAEKLVKILKIIEDRDIIYNPTELFKIIEKNRKNKVDQYTQNLLILHRNLQDYYTRYKSKYPGYYTEFVNFIKNK